MGWENSRRVLIPHHGEDILQGITDMGRTLGVITAASSHAEARELAKSGNITVDPTHPANFNINGILYYYDGNTFIPFNQPEEGDEQLATGTELLLKDRYYSILLRATLPRRPYPRRVKAWGWGYGQILAGRVNLSIEITGVTATNSRFVSGADDASSTSVFNTAYVPENVQPVVTMGFRGDYPGSNRIQTATNPTLNRMHWEATPAPTK